jgi:hypothetical protein
VPSFVGKEDQYMARTSTDPAELLQNAYDKSREFVGTVQEESRAIYDEARRWIPKHPTAVAVSASAALTIGVAGYALGRRRAARAAAGQGTLSAAVARVPELDLSPFFRFLKLWMLFRVATRD